jgi:hypothetical protein
MEEALDQRTEGKSHQSDRWSNSDTVELKVDTSQMMTQVKK